MWVPIITDSSTRTLWQIPAETPSSEAGVSRREVSVDFAGEVYLLYSEGILCREILRHGSDGFTSTPKEVMLQIFIALKNPSSSANH
jgi:hypothetical protein